MGMRSLRDKSPSVSNTRLGSQTGVSRMDHAVHCQQPNGSVLLTEAKGLNLHRGGSKVHKHKGHHTGQSGVV